jgi:hypothetical protein
VTFNWAAEEGVGRLTRKGKRRSNRLSGLFRDCPFLSLKHKTQPLITRNWVLIRFIVPPKKGLEVLRYDRIVISIPD